MLVILSTSKTQDLKSTPPYRTSQPRMQEQALLLNRRLQSLDTSALSKLMKTSPKLTALTREKIEKFRIPHTPENAAAALTVFKGDAFSALTLSRYSDEDFDHADRHIRILSGLYGILSPLDLIQPYRLEMGTRMETDCGSSLYDFWGDKVTTLLNSDLEKMKSRIIVNCASNEYSRVVKKKDLHGEMITLSFKQEKQGQLKSIAIYSKRARGMFTDFFIKNRISQQSQLADFHEDGYRLRDDLSTPAELVFVKKLD